MKKTILFLFSSILLVSCASHKRSNIKSTEEFVVELKKPTSRGGVVDVAFQGLFLGATYLAERSVKALTNSYSHSISVNDYYNTDLGDVEKTYSEIHIKKFSKPWEEEEKMRIKNIITEEVKSLPVSRGQAGTLALKDIIREKENDLLNFHAVIELISDPNNPGVTRLSFNELRVFFSETKIFEDEDLNAQISIQLVGQWRNTDGSPMVATLMEQEYDFKNLKYGIENQITEPILSPWYVDIPILQELENDTKYGVLMVNIQMKEYEGNKSKYINKLPSILSDNKNAIIKNGASTIQKITN